MICSKMLHKISSEELIDLKKSNKLVFICLILAARVIAELPRAPQGARERSPIAKRFW